MGLFLAMVMIVLTLKCIQETLNKHLGNQWTPRWNATLCCISLVSKLFVQGNIYFINVAALDETIIPSCLHFLMQNIEQSHGLGHASRWNNVNVNQ